MNLATLAARNLRRRPMRTGLTVASVGLAVAAFVALTMLAGGMESAFRDSLDARSTDALVSEHGVVDLLASLVPEDLARKIAEVPEVAATSPELVRVAPAGETMQALIAGWPPDSFLWEGIGWVDGRGPKRGEQGVAVLGEALASSLKAGTGDRVELFLEPFTVIGIMSSSSAINRSLAIVPLADLQALTFRSGQATTIHVKLRQGLSPDAEAMALDHVRAVAGSYAVEATDEAVRDNGVVRMARALSWAISLIALVIGIIGVLNTQTMAMNERLGEIAMLSAIGWSRSRILRAALLEGLLIAAAGGAPGMVLGVVASRAVAALPQLRGFLDPTPSVALLVEVALAVLVLGALGALLPAWRATAGEPATMLRQR